MGALCIVMDISAFTIAMVRCGADTAADLLIIDSADTVIACLLNATMQKQKNRFITVALGLLFIIFIDQVPVLKRIVSTVAGSSCAQVKDCVVKVVLSHTP